MIDVFIDTNIYIKLLTDSNDKFIFFESLKKLIDAEVINLIVPEVVLLELEKENRTAIHNFDSEKRLISNDISNIFKSKWSEVRNIKHKLITLVEKDINLKKQMWQEQYKNLKSYLKSDKVNFIEFTPEIMCLGEKRRIEQRVPTQNSNRYTQDSYNLESILYYINNTKYINHSELIFCTSDKKDFFKLTGKDKLNSKKFYDLHRILQSDFINTKGVLNLETIDNYINPGYSLEDLYEKLNMYIPNEDSIDRYSDLSEIYHIPELSELKETTINIDELIELSKKEFESCPDEILDYRKNILKEIESLYAEISIHLDAIDIHQIEFICNYDFRECLKLSLLIDMKELLKKELKKTMKSID
ncbi:MAG: PIN domain-containing protein [Paeniclostridium sordellii]|nr:PIN domain-containing protein [Paeniclostridium sordellii]